MSEKKSSSNTDPVTSRLGFMNGEWSVPDDFDDMYAEEIADLFEADNLFPSNAPPPISRPLTQSERCLVEFLVHLAGLEHVHGLDDALVQEMNDGGMGSLQFGESREGRLGHVVAEAKFADDDGLPVFASLVLDQTGSLYELDVWKVDFSPLRRIPDPSHFQPPS